MICALIFPSSGCYNKGSGTYACLPCPDGYKVDGESCTDIDEVRRVVSGWYLVSDPVH